MARVIRQHSSSSAGRPPPVLLPVRKARGDPSAEVEQCLAAYTDRAIALTKSRHFVEARLQCEQAIGLICRTQQTSPHFQLNLSLLGELCYRYGALLAGMGDFSLATHYLTQARECFSRGAIKALLKGPRHSYYRFRFGQRAAELEGAYVALRRRKYDEAVTQIARLLTSAPRSTEPAYFKRLRAAAHLLMGWTHYEQRQYHEARQQVTQALDCHPALQEADTLDVLTKVRLLHTAGRSEEGVSIAIAGCRRFLRRLELDCVEMAAAPEQLEAFLQAIHAAQRDPQVWACIRPDEREELGEWLVVFGALQHPRLRTVQAIRLFLLAGTLLPQAEVRDIPEFERLARDLGERARQEPLAFATLTTLLTHPLVLRRWEFLEAVLEAVGRVPLSPALACVAALRTALPATLPPDTTALVEQIGTDLEGELKIDSRTAGLLGVRVLANASVRFVVTAPFSRATLDVLLNQIEAIVQHWQPPDSGMLDPDPCTTETEELTNALEEGMLQRFSPQLLFNGTNGNSRGQ
jgi:tetratricopeptide (TPR) repeat protein